MAQIVFVEVTEPEFGRRFQLKECKQKSHDTPSSDSSSKVGNNVTLFIKIRFFKKNLLVSTKLSNFVQSVQFWVAIHAFGSNVMWLCESL